MKETATPEELEKLLQAAKYRPLTPAEREEQRRSFAYGNANIENSDVTRETVDEQADQLNEIADVRSAQQR